MGVYGGNGGNLILFVNNKKFICRNLWRIIENDYAAKRRWKCAAKFILFSGNFAKLAIGRSLELGQAVSGQCNEMGGFCWTGNYSVKRWLCLIAGLLGESQAQFSDFFTDKWVRWQTVRWPDFADKKIHWLVNSRRVTAKGTGPQGRSQCGLDSIHRRSCGTCL